MRLARLLQIIVAAVREGRRIYDNIRKLCIAAVRMVAFDLAVGNLFGSNVFNMTIFPAMNLMMTARRVALTDKGLP